MHTYSAKNTELNICADCINCVCVSCVHCSCPSLRVVESMAGYTFTPCVGYFTSPGTYIRYKGPTAFSVSSERSWRSVVNCSQHTDAVEEMGKHQDGRIEICRGGERPSVVGESHSGGRTDGRMWGGGIISYMQWSVIIMQTEKIT